MTLDYRPEHLDLLDTVPLSPGSVIQTEGVAYDESGAPLDGLLVWDAAADGPRPGVLVLHDWTGEGEYVRTRARMLARLGYVAFTADIYGTGIRPVSDAAAEQAHAFYADLPLLRERVRAGFEVLRHDPRVDPERIAVIGYCFGGSAAVEFARTGAAVVGTVSFHGGLITHEPADVAAIAAPLLVLTGAADPVVPDAAVVAFEDELRTAPELDWQIVSYSGAPHAFTLPSTPNYRPKADRRSWVALQQFLAEVFG
ncbi:dienelactone hydrolase family protein [Herbiconiux daphne]|uniref:Dienelactone hydrolase family protein n=1 Tax=Herbiconiux daphne TaxID=2970914 RepID=A0ABT2H131_9MICO|nr:dienelactone hydrolase family protein [Herbiconiux daphne]MCS5733643.1 dienelactone hydrolase family protein [Herbiconiux daphne]